MVLASLALAAAAAASTQPVPLVHAASGWGQVLFLVGVRSCFLYKEQDLTPRLAPALTPRLP